MPLSYIDSSVLIDAFNGKSAIAKKALAILNDPNRQFASCEFVKLELLLKPAYFKNAKETAFYQAFFAKVNATAYESLSPSLVADAFTEGTNAGLSAGDAVHVAAAVRLKCDDLLTSEAPHSAIHRATSLPVKSIR